MKTSTLLSRPLLLVVMLAVSWAASVPLHERSRRETTLSGGVHHQVNPIGHSLSASGTVEHAINDNHSLFGTVSGTRNTIPGLGSFDALSAGGGYNYSPSDGTTVTLGGRTNRLPGGISSVVGSAGVEHSWDNNRHSLSGVAEVERHDTGFNNFNSHRAGLNYNYNINRDATLSLGAHRTWTPFGRDTGAGLNFIYRG